MKVQRIDPGILIESEARKDAHTAGAQSVGGLQR